MTGDSLGGVIGIGLGKIPLPLLVVYIQLRGDYRRSMPFPLASLWAEASSALGDYLECVLLRHVRFELIFQNTVHVRATEPVAQYTSGIDPPAESML